MFRFKPVPRSHRIDLDTIRETIAYIRDDVAAEPGLTDVASALQKAILALDAAASPEDRAGIARTPVVARFFASRS